MSALALLLVLASLSLDVAGQVLFKIGLNRLEQHCGATARPFWLAVPRSPWLLGGVAAYSIEIPLWTAVLGLLPLSIAFPMASLSYCGVAAAARFVLHEPVPARRWLATALIAGGVAIVAGSAGGG